MPCYEPALQPEDYRHAGEGMAVLCAFCTRLEREGKPIPVELRHWWEAHKERDGVKR